VERAQWFAKQREQEKLDLAVKQAERRAALEASRERLKVTSALLC